jgi:predicted TIM-barrel fold metal-dependent hydrolase
MSSRLKPRLPRVFDAHFHIFEPGFQLLSNQGFKPDHFSVDDYSKWRTKCNIQGGACVAASTQGTDTSFLSHVLAKLGTNFVGIIEVQDDSITNQEIQSLKASGVRGVRFNLKRSVSPKQVSVYLEDFAKRIHQEAGWHVELYIDGTGLNELYDVITKLPKVSIDHLGFNSDSHEKLKKFSEREDVRIKATGFGRVNFDVLKIMKELNHINPEVLMFGTDLPCTRAKRYFDEADLQLVLDKFSQAEQDKILWRNSASWYSIDGSSNEL